MTLLCSPFGIIYHLCNPLTLVCYPRTSKLPHFHIIHALSLLFNKTFLPSSDLGVLPKDLCATSPERFASRFSEAHEVTDLLVLFVITPWIFMVDRKIIELIYMRARSKKLHQISAKKVVGLPIHRGAQRLLTSFLSQCPSSRHAESAKLKAKLSG